MRAVSAQKPRCRNVRRIADDEIDLSLETSALHRDEHVALQGDDALLQSESPHVVTRGDDGIAAEVPCPDAGVGAMRCEGDRQVARPAAHIDANRGCFDFVEQLARRAAEELGLHSRTEDVAVYF